MHDKPWTLGVSASHNGSACLLYGDTVVVAVQEERLSGVKRDRVYGAAPHLCLRYCLDYARIQPKDLATVAIAVQGRLTDPAHDIRNNPLLELNRWDVPVMTLSHHRAHAIAAYATSGFPHAAILVIDGLGSPFADLADDERACAVGVNVDGWESISFYEATGTDVVAIEKHLVKGTEWLTVRPDGMATFASLGGMFSAAALQMFGDPMEAGKVMGLAPYGQQTIPASEFFEIVDGRFVFSDAVPSIFRYRGCWPQHAAEYQNLACSVQCALEVGVLALVERLRRRSQSDLLCYGGGVALNSVTNERIYRESTFSDIHMLSASEDSGAAIGAAYYGLWHSGHRIKPSHRLSTDSLGKRYSDDTVAAAIASVPALNVISETNVVDLASALIANGNVVGWFQEGSELGPRSLGHRSILFDARLLNGQSTLNTRVKHREEFRPFAPACLLEELRTWFDIPDGIAIESPFMLRVAPFRAELRARVPAVVHVDGTGRLQSVTRDNGRFYELIRRFYEMTGVPILLNTSFNMAGEPIVETPEDALWCMLATGIDYCVVNDVVIGKQATFRSLLELVPQLTSSAYCAVTMADTHPSGAHRDQCAGGLAPVFDNLTTRRLSGMDAMLVMTIDGQLNGWDILDRIRDLAECERVGLRLDRQTMSPLCLERAMSRLRRLGVIRLSTSGKSERLGPVRK